MPDSPERSLPQQGAGAAGDFFKFVHDALSDDAVRAQVLADLGLDPANGTSTPPPAYVEHLDSIDRYRKQVDADAAAYAAAIADLKELYTAVTQILDASAAGSQEVQEELYHRFFRLLSLSYLRVRYPILFWIGQALGFLGESLDVDRMPNTPGISAYLKEPVHTLAEVYRGAWPIETEAQAKTLSDATLAPLGVLIGFWQKTFYKLLRKAGLYVELPVPQILYGWEAGAQSPTPVGDRIGGRTLSFVLEAFPSIGTSPPPDPPGPPCSTPDVPPQKLDGRLSVALAWVPREHGGPGMLVAVGGAEELSLPLGDGWAFAARLSSAAALDFFVRDWDDVGVGGPSDASLLLTLERPASPAGPYVLSLGDGVRLEMEALSLRLGLASSGPTFGLLARNSALIVETGSDAVFSRAVAAERFRADFDLGLGFANGRFYVEGGSDLHAVLPVGRVAGPLRIQSVTLELEPGAEPARPDVRVEVSASVVVELGKLTLTVDRIGFAGAMDFWDAPALGFKPPNGVGVAVDAEVVRGGGYLFYDKDKAQYGGVLDLDVKDLFTVKAVGLLTTRLPDGRPGFSFLAILYVENFTPINLGLGFRLTGVGGLLGYDRTVSMPALEAGLKTHALDRILFPPDPVANAAAIVSTAGAVFPPARDQMIVGLMAQIEWGPGAPVTVELGLILELPAPGRLVILGKLRAAFPHKQAPVVTINVDVVGEIDFVKKRAFAHAVLVDSKIAGFPLNGAAALLLRWDEDPVFVLAFGGVNPRYEQRLPAGFPKLERLSVALTRGNNPRIRLEAYTAVTSNSFQIGGKLEVFASAGKFSIDGLLVVDALFQSGEPSVVFDLLARLQLKAWGTNLFTVKFEGTFQGWRPSRIRGKATFEIWIFDYSVQIDHTFGAAAPPPSLPAVDLRTPLLAALRDPSNWQVLPPDARSNLVTLRAGQPANDLLLHPLGRLAVSQRVVPLGVQIDHVGGARPAGGARFSIDAATVGGAAVSTEPVTDQFARAQYFDMSDDEKLSAPPFERMVAGVAIGSGGVAHGPGVPASFEYDTLVYDAVAGATTPAPAYALTPERLDALADVSAAAVNDPERTGAARYRGPARPVTIAWSRYVVASTEDLAEKAVPGIGAGGARTYSEAVAALRAHTAAHPEQRGRLQLVARNG
jgi:hypothetical protein